MRTKQEIVENWLPRYTERKLEDFTKHILLTNFTKYVEIFADHFNVPILGLKSSMPNASAEGITIINFGMGSANAATIMDLLSAVMPKAVLFLGKCGGLKRANVLGDYVLPIAAIRGEGTSNEYLPPEVPSLPAFSMLRAISSAIRDHGKIIGQVRFTRQIAGFGNTIMISRNIFVVRMPLVSIWKPQPCLLPVSLTKYLRVHC